MEKELKTMKLDLILFPLQNINLKTMEMEKTLNPLNKYEIN